MTKAVKLSNGLLYRLTPEGAVEVVHNDGSLGRYHLTTCDIRSLYSLVDNGKSIREAKREGYRWGIADAADLLRRDGYHSGSNHLWSNSGAWEGMAKTQYPDPVKYREIKIGGLRYRCKDGVLECHTRTGWQHAGENTEYIKALAYLIDNPLEKI